jgi:hypothetical protein
MGGLMPDVCQGRACCDRCAGAAAAARTARRRLLKAAVFGLQDGAESAGDRPPEGAGSLPDRDRQRDHNGFPVTGEFPRAITGTVLDASPQVLTLDQGTGELRLALTADATAWRGRQLDPVALQPGDQAIVRLHRSQRGVADRIWANIGRVTGTIVQRDENGLLVDEGATRRRQVVLIPSRAAGRIQVRFPNLQPGYLVDVIGFRRGTALEALIPATSQPAYRADRPPAAQPVGGHVPAAISGSATWHDHADEPATMLGVAYPAIDPEAGCAEVPSGGARAGGHVRLPYLAVGSLLRVRNDCAGRSCVLPVIGCAPVARLFNDRCITCGTSRRGRVADLTMASFIALGGELERGCFNATITMGL